MSGISAKSGGLPFQLHARQLEKLPPCQAMCPNSGDIRGWLGIIAQREKNGLSLDEACDRAWERLVEFNPMPATIGRICPHPCEDLCSRHDKDGAVSINAMERFLGDWGLSRSLPLPSAGGERHAESVGVIGSGPASLSFAYQMVRRGYRVTIYERDAHPGGMLRHAIPDYRLPREVLDAEVNRILDLDIELVLGADVSDDRSLASLRQSHAVVFLGLGAQAARGLDIPGESGPGVLSGIDYLRLRKESGASPCGKRVVVIGGGNTAIDAARSARREGAAVTLLYRRSEAEMPAAAHEVDDARAEGVKFSFLVAPTRIVRANSRVHYVETQSMRLGEPDDAGRRRPIPVPGQMQQFPADTVIVAVSQSPGWHGCGEVFSEGNWLQAQDDGRLADGLWAGGDDRGPGIASGAIAQGRHAAESVHAELRGLPRPPQAPVMPRIDAGVVKTDYYAERQRATTARRSPEEWLSDPDAEISRTLTREQAADEAARCMSCGLCFDCRQCFMYCNAAGFSRFDTTRPGHYFDLALEACEGCGKCIEVCPCGYLEVRETAS